MHTDYKYPTRLGGAEPPWTFAIGFARRDPAAPPVQGTTSHPTRFLARPSRLRDGPAPRPRRDRLHELGAGDRDLSGGSQGGEICKKSKYAGRAGMARRHPGPVDKGRLLRPTCAKNEGFVIRAADLETGFYTMKSPMRPEETTFHTRVCEIEGRGGHCRPDRRRRLRETPSAWPPFPSRSRQRKTRDRNAPAPINPFYMRVIPLGHLRCLISL